MTMSPKCKSNINVSPKVPFRIEMFAARPVAVKDWSFASSAMLPAAGPDCGMTTDGGAVAVISVPLCPSDAAVMI